MSYDFMKKKTNVSKYSKEFFDSIKQNNQIIL